MIFAWIGLGLLGLIMLVLLIGSLMGERFEGRSQVTYARPAEEVWDALLDYGHHPMTGKMMKGVEALPDENGLPAWVEDMGHGEKITVKTVEAERPTRMVRDMSSAAVPMTSRWDYALEPVDGGCRLTLEGVTTIRKGTWHVPIFRVMMAVGGGVKKGLDIQMNMVASTLGVDATRA